MSANVPAPDPARFRNVLGRVPTSVVVVTGMGEDARPYGITIGSFTSVSLEPLLVGFLPGIGSRSWAAIRTSGRFCVNVLSARQAEVCWRFAKEGDDKFEGLSWRPSAGGSPILDGVAAWIDCALDSETVVGDHYFVVGQVESLDADDLVHDAMVFFRGQVTGVAPDPS